jgi:hypothetical protein
LSELRSSLHPLTREELVAEIERLHSVDRQKTLEINILVAENRKAARVIQAAVELVKASSWSGVSDEDVILDRVLRECGYVTS